MKKVKKEKLEQAVEAAKSEIQAALETVYGALNQGQQKQIVKDERVKKLFDRHGVKHSE